MSPGLHRRRRRGVDVNGPAVPIQGLGDIRAVHKGTDDAVGNAEDSAGAPPERWGGAGILIGVVLLRGTRGRDDDDRAHVLVRLRGGLKSGSDKLLDSPGSELVEATAFSETWRTWPGVARSRE